MLLLEGEEQRWTGNDSFRVTTGVNS
jgi:hypothetical protein